ncbi:hypothetical protein KQH42_00505 [Streptomyces sp. CHA1]|uniref:hypothetical protein n=1 Tax=unclassified Streptomyces TaxID=2593676 RepID=UPI001BFC71D9|nr:MULTISPECIES: hypothetical protein [unclassified Streptomyces]MBT3157824.1 hypothetical protein [Streptomyces sp. G11C]MCO6699047.1 hypothetical protein [Streptomyces sp. CHB9.2]MCO6705337.1 hypothetical protein [Streptomyces sp. CHA3]MCO6711104.1 hypothetical protein [Streptomyces sp. CHB19.2]MCO6717216.1 hypothetical protein [Streptomyces sp. Vc714c-19]
MELRNALLRAALARPAVLTAVLPGATRARLSVERELRARRWPRALSPAAADLLVVVGRPGEEEPAWLEGTWQALSEPRALVRVKEAAGAGAALDAGHAVLLRGGRRAGTAAGGDVRPHHVSPATGLGHPGHTRADHAHSGHSAAHSHGTPMLDTPMLISGLPLADRADDRDGLRLDRLHVPFGPVLPDWPAGLVVRLALQGDVVQEVTGVELVPAAPATRSAFWDEPWREAAAGVPVTRGAAARRRCAAHLDSLGRLLAVADWPDAATRARRLRDAALADAPAAELAHTTRRLTRRVGRSRTLRWLTSGIGVLPRERALAAGIGGPALEADGDVWRRTVRWLAEAARAAEACDDPRPLPPGDPYGPRGDLTGEPPPSRALLDVLPSLLHGAELAAARLTLASLDPDPDELVPVAAGEAARG